MTIPFWEGQYAEGITHLEGLGVVPTWKRDDFTTQELQIIATKVQNCNSLNELLSLLRGDLSTANCSYEGPKQTGREVADYLEKIFAGEKMTLTELRAKTFYIGLGILEKVSLLALTEKLTKEALRIDGTTDDDFGLIESWPMPLNTSRPKEMPEEEWLKMQNNITIKRPRVKTKEELEASLPKAFPVTWDAQVPTDTREPENLNHWDTWLNTTEQSNSKSSTIVPMQPQDTRSSQEQLKGLLGENTAAPKRSSLLNSQFPSNYEIEKVFYNGTDVTAAAKNKNYYPLMPNILRAPITPPSELSQESLIEPRAYPDTSSHAINQANDILNASSTIDWTKVQNDFDTPTSVFDNGQKNLRPQKGNGAELKPSASAQVLQQIPPVRVNVEPVVVHQDPLAQNPSPKAIPSEEDVPLTQSEQRLSSFEKPIAAQNTISDLCALLISTDYKNKKYGIGTDAITGNVLAERIVNTVWRAEIGTMIDTTLFIPEPAIAQRVEVILSNSLDWQESESEEGTVIFEKVRNTTLSQDVQESVDRVFAAVIKKVKPGIWPRMKKWVNSGIVSRKEVSETRKQVGKVGFWASLIAVLGIGVAAYSQEGKTENVSQAPVQPVVEANKDSRSAGISSTVQQERVPSMKTVTGVDPKTGEEYRIQVPNYSATNANSRSTQLTGVQQTRATSTGILPVQRTNAEQTSNNPVNVAMPTDAAGDNNANASANPANVPMPSDPEDTQGKSNPSDVAIPTDASNEAAPHAVERPASFESVTDFKNYFAKTGKLAAFERLYGYADGQAEKNRNHLPNLRAYWFETMLLEKPKEVLRTNAGGGMTPSELQYAIKRYRQQETGFSDNQIDPIDISEIRAKQDAFTEWHAKYIGPLNEELKRLGSTSEVLANPNATMAEYLVDVIDRAEKNGLGDKIGLSPLTTDTLQEIANFKPKVSADDLSFEKITSAAVDALKNNTLRFRTNRTSGVDNQESSPDYQVSERTDWLRDTLSGATLDGVEYGNLRDINDWLNYRLNPVIEGYWDQKRLTDSLRGGAYTVTDLQYMINGFKELGTRLDRLGRRDAGGNSVPVDTDRTAQIQRIINDLEDGLANKQSRSNTPGGINT